MRGTLRNRDYEPLLSNAWIGQLDHFLFKSDNVTEIENLHTVREISLITKNKIKMAMNVLIEFFDIVLVDGNVIFFRRVVEIYWLVYCWTSLGEDSPVSDKGGLL